MAEPNIISELPDELILKIFSLLPLYKEGVATHLLTKLRMEGPWKLVPDFMFDDDDDDDENFVTFMSFIYGSLLFNNDQILEMFHLKLSRKYSASDINTWVKLSVKRSVRKLRIQTFGRTLKLPSCLSTCVTLKSLILHEVRIKVVPSCFRLPSLKSLHIFFVQFPGDASLASLLQSCPDLEYLVVGDVVVNTLPPWCLLSSLKSLHLISTYFSEDKSAASLLRICPVLEDLVVNQTHQVFNNHVPITCRTLKTLILRDLTISVVPPFFCLPSLKSLHLISAKFSGDESFADLIQRRCPVLEDLVINKTSDDNVMIFNINAPSLRSLSIDNSIGKRTYVEENHGFVINAPSLEKMNFKDTFSNFLVFEHMPDVIEANVQVICCPSNKFIGSLTSIRHLSLCSLSSETPYPRGTTFPYLEHLELCTCSAGWANLLVCILKDAPTVKYLKLKSNHRAHYNDPMLLWKERTSVPECLSTHLEILEWRQYEGTEQERNVAAYILANATCLKTATFSTWCKNKHHRMLKKLKKLNRVSDTCQLLFD